MQTVTSRNNRLVLLFRVYPDKQMRRLRVTVFSGAPSFALGANEWANIAKEVLLPYLARLCSTPNTFFCFISFAGNHLPLLTPSRVPHSPVPCACVCPCPYPARSFPSLTNFPSKGPPLFSHPGPAPYLPTRKPLCYASSVR